jgi:hypothetical protein
MRILLLQTSSSGLLGQWNGNSSDDLQSNSVSRSGVDASDLAAVNDFGKSCTC